MWNPKMWLSGGYFYLVVKFLLTKALFSWWNRASVILKKSSLSYPQGRTGEIRILENANSTFHLLILTFFSYLGEYFNRAHIRVNISITLILGFFRHFENILFLFWFFEHVVNEFWKTNEVGPTGNSFP